MNIWQIEIQIRTVSDFKAFRMGVFVLFNRRFTDRNKSSLWHNRSIDNVYVNFVFRKHLNIGSIWKTISLAFTLKTQLLFGTQKLCGNYTSFICNVFNIVSLMILFFFFFIFLFSFITRYS